MTRTVAVPDVQDIDGVLAALRTVVDDAARAGDRIGLFAAVYRQVTAAIARASRKGSSTTPSDSTASTRCSPAGT